MLFFLLSQSTINPVDAVYQPSPLEQSVISTMPSQAVIPPGMVCRKNLRGNTLEQSRVQLQSRCWAAEQWAASVPPMQYRCS